MNEPDSVPRYHTCRACRKREGTVRWGDTLALTHGFDAWVCPRCAARAQLRHALGRAARIPKLAWKSVRG